MQARFRQLSAEYLADFLRRIEAVVERLSEDQVWWRANAAVLSDEDLAEVRQIQGQDTDGVEAVLHIVEHMSYHTGQIVHIAKELLGPEASIDFYPQHRGE